MTYISFLDEIKGFHDIVAYDEANKHLKDSSCLILRMLENLEFSKLEKNEITRQVIKLPFEEYKKLENNPEKLHEIYESLCPVFEKRLRDIIRKEKEQLSKFLVLPENCVEVHKVVDPDSVPHALTFTGGKWINTPDDPLGFKIRVSTNFVGAPYFCFFYQGKDLFGSRL